MDDATLRHFPRAQVQHGCWSGWISTSRLSNGTDGRSNIFYTFFEDLIPCFLVWVLFNGNYHSVRKLCYFFLLGPAPRSAIVLHVLPSSQFLLFTTARLSKLHRVSRLGVNLGEHVSVTLGERVPLDGIHHVSLVTSFFRQCHALVRLVSRLPRSFLDHSLLCAPCGLCFFQYLVFPMTGLKHAWKASEGRIPARGKEYNIIIFFKIHYQNQNYLRLLTVVSDCFGVSSRRILV